MTHPAPRSAAPAETSEESVGQLMATLTDQMSRLVRDEMRLAQLELTSKAKRAGIGAGLFGGAGAIAFYGMGALIAAAIAGLALAVHLWLAALIVGVVLLAVAGMAALLGKREVSQAVPPVPQEALESVKHDVHAIKPGGHRA